MPPPIRLGVPGVWGELWPVLLLLLPLPLVALPLPLALGVPPLIGSLWELLTLGGPPGVIG